LLDTKIKWTLASLILHDAYTDFMLSRQAMNCTPSTIQFYRYTVGVFLAWCEAHNVHAPQEVTARLVRQYLAELVSRGRKDTTVWDHARAIKTMLRFWLNEGYITTAIKFDLPKLEKKRLLVLTPEQLQIVLQACNVRDRALVLFMVDSGLRRGEVCALNWADVDMTTGLVAVRRGKGGKARSSVIGARTRRALLAYRRTLADRDGALFQTAAGARFTGSGLLSIFRRLSRRTQIRVNPHSLRRTFVILSLRAGMDVLHLKALLGHADFAMVEHYAQMEQLDLVQAHREHSPVDRLGATSQDTE
jgi:site-specific recombinase XerD